MSSSTNSVLGRLDTILNEHLNMARALDSLEIQALVDAMIAAKRVFFSAQGRSGLMGRALAIRLMHIGLPVYVTGEPSTPAIGEGDLLIAVSSSAKTATTVEHMRIAREQGAKVVLISSEKRNVGLGILSLTLPSRTVVATVQHAGSLFEQAFLLLGDAIAWQIQKRLGIEDRFLNERHANLQ